MKEYFEYKDESPWSIIFNSYYFFILSNTFIYVIVGVYLFVVTRSLD